MMRRVVIALAFVAVLAPAMLHAAEPAAIAADELDRLHRLIKPAPGESRWMEIEWHPTVWEARRKAAREGKPIFLWAGSGGAPAAGC